MGLEPGEDAEEFYNELLPSAVENFLVLGERYKHVSSMQLRYVCLLRGLCL